MVLYGMSKSWLLYSGRLYLEVAAKTGLTVWIRDHKNTIATELKMAERNSYVSKESYRVSCIDDIMNIPDMSTARELLRSWGIPTRGIRQKDEAVQKLVNHWKLNDKGDSVKEEVYTPNPLYVLLLHWLSQRINKSFN